LLLLFITGDQSYQILERRFMIGEVQMTALITGLQTGLYKVDERVLNAMSRVPRQEFIGDRYMDYAYKNVALPLAGEKHVIPEPFLTAMMIHLMGVTKQDRVLEIGHGTGYEAAVLSKIAKSVYSIRQENPVNIQFKTPYEQQLSGYTNVTARDGNGIYGWAEKGPFDAILVKQSLPAPPQTLLNQLKPYGRLVIPIDDGHQPEQRVVVYLKLPGGKLEKRETLYVKITPLLKGEEI
jgi:protein-L-isoaspartate(D-aspartate) O-methyltransferase